MQSKNFYVGFDDSASRGRIYLRNKHFANFWQIENWTKESNGKFAFNRDALALRVDCPIIESQETLENILEILEKWFASKE
ncbi:MAG: hypothetical protein Q7R95_11445 [bacterium]|nr:hypothetical protein [bacterium]